MAGAKEALVHLASDVSSLGEGRRFIARTLREWKVDEDCIEAVVLVANELMANAIVHANSAPVVALEADGGNLLVRVGDSSPGLPVARVAGLDATGGRGLALVETLADRWGIGTTPEGKVVWAAFDGAIP